VQIVHPSGETPTNSLSISLKVEVEEGNASTDYIHSHVRDNSSNCWPPSVLYRIT
jgi:hypothetical protein